MILIKSVFLGMVHSSLTASIIIIMIMLIKKVLNNKISARIHYALWLIVLVRLAFPFLPESGLSIFNLFQIETLNSFVQQETTNQANVIIEEDDQILENLYQNQGVNNFPSINHEETNPNLQYNGVLNESEKNNNTGKLIYEIIIFVWAIGFAAMVTYITISASKMKAKAKHFELVDDKRLVTLLDALRKKIGVEKRISIYAGNHLISPCIAGVINPRIYFPKPLIENINEDEFSHVLLHELGHYKRKDQVWNIVSVAVLSVHWFNPLVWVAMNKMKIDRELACDAYVLEMIGEEQAVSYGMTIIEMLKNYALPKNTPNPLILLHFNEQKNNIEKRIRLIINFKKGSYRKISAAAILLYGLIGLIALTNAEEQAYNISQDMISNHSGMERRLDQIEDRTKQVEAAKTVAIENSKPIVNEESIHLKNIFDDDSRVYSDIDDVLKEFQYKAPDYIPDSYEFSKAIARMSQKSVKISYQSPKSRINLELSARPETEERKALFLPLREGGKIDLYEEGSNNAYRQGENLTIGSQNVLKISTMYGPYDEETVRRIEYVWENGGAQYTLSQYMSLSRDPFSGDPFSDEEMLKIVAAMKPADRITNVTYKNASRSARIYDTGDLHEAIKVLGFVPELSLYAGEGYQAKSADVSKKSNLIYHADTPCFRTIYSKPGERKNDLCEFEQLKDKKIYSRIKSDESFEANMISGSHDTIQVTQTIIEGKEVYKTEVYQKYENEVDDDEIYSAVTYFWEKNDYFCNATFNADGENQEQVVQALINQEPVVLSLF